MQIMVDEVVERSLRYGDRERGEEGKQKRGGERRNVEGWRAGANWNETRK
jgi:hypothetical protein